MNVTCNRCSTEYEFEEALVSPRGTTVKCTQCGHLFKVQRASHVAQLSSWTIRRTDGTTHTLADLSELPRRIREGSFGRDDELSRTGRLWRRLGDVDELDEHFVAADRRGPSRGQPVVRDSAEKLDNALPPPALPLDPQPEQRDSVHAVEAYRKAGVRNESFMHAWARLLASAVIVVAIAFWFFSLPTSGEQWNRAQSPAAAVSDPSERFFASGERALATHRIDHFDAALVEYIKALAYHEQDAHILSAVSRVHALWAQELASDHELAQGPADNAALQITAHAEQALSYAELALQSQPGSSEAELARADALRLTGDVAGARAMLDRALAHMPVGAETLRVAALQGLAEGAHEEGHTAVELATQAVAIDPGLLRARFLFARLLLTQGDFEGTRAQLDAIQAKDPKHPGALRLAAQLDVAAQAATHRDEEANGELAICLERGRAQLAAGQLSAAKRTLEHALTLQPDSVPVHAALGQVAIARGRHLQAIDHLVAAALAGDADSLIALAETYRRLGRQHEALAAYQSYLQQNPRGPQLELAKTQSERLIEKLSEQLASARKP